MFTISDWSTTTFRAAEPFEESGMSTMQSMWMIAAGLALVAALLVVRASADRRRWMARAALTALLSIAISAAFDLQMRLWSHMPAVGLFIAVGVVTSALVVALTFEWIVTTFLRR